MPRADLLPIWYEALRSDPSQLQIVIVQRSKEILKGDTNDPLRPVVEQSLQARTASVKAILNASVSAVGKDWIRYETEGQTESLTAATIVWTAGCNSSCNRTACRRSRISRKRSHAEGLSPR